jgi:ribonuclease BN (tRNA processing enzyme)
MKNRIVILGSGTCNLVPEKAAASTLIEINGVRLVYDFGRGVSNRLVELGLRQDDVQHIFLSHFHPDHVDDIYAYLHAASWSQIDRRTKDLHFYGPPGLTAFLTKMFAVFDWQHELSRDFTVACHDIAKSFTIAHQTFELVDLHHSHGLRFGPYVIAGDSAFHNDLIALLKHAPLAVFDAGHLDEREIVELAVRTQVRQLICSHQYRALNEAHINKTAAAEGFEGKLVVAKDLMALNLPAGIEYE